MICCKCGNNTNFDWRTGKREGFDPTKVYCSKCFKTSIDNLCKRIENATPDILDAVFILGMAEFNASQEALSFMKDVDLDEDLNNGN